MMYEDFISDFIKRTIENLEFIEKINFKNSQSKIKVFEKTQLINSLIGLLIIPHQTYYDSINDSYINKSDLKELKKAVVENKYIDEITDDLEEINLKNIIRHMRNAVAHNQLLFYNQDGEVGRAGEIFLVAFQDFNPKDESQYFKLKISIDLFRKIIIEFANTVASLQLHDKTIQDRLYK